MIGKCKDVVAFQKHLDDLACSGKITKLHFTFHQKALHQESRTTNFKSIINTVVKAVYVILLQNESVSVSPAFTGRRE